MPLILAGQWSAMPVTTARAISTTPIVVWREDHSKRFILQRINTDTFTDPVGLMENICGVTRHLRAQDPCRRAATRHA